MMIDNYGENFYESVSKRAEETAEPVIKILFSFINQVDSLKDVGCGSGIWLKKFVDTGKIKHAIGFDLENAVNSGTTAVNKKILVKSIDFEKLDENIFPKTDLSLFLEVAEHLTEETAKKIIRYICKTSNMIIFSAAIPGQGGYNHMNEKPMNYWVAKLEDNEFYVFDVFREQLNSIKNLPFYYCNNLILGISKNYYEENKVELDSIKSYKINSASQIKDYRNLTQKIQYKLLSFFDYRVINKIVLIKDYFYLKKFNTNRLN